MIVLVREEVRWYKASEPPPVGLSVLGRTRDMALGTVLVYWSGRHWALTTYGDRYRATGLNVTKWCFLPEGKKNGAVEDKARSSSSGESISRRSRDKHDFKTDGNGEVHR